MSKKLLLLVLTATIANGSYIDTFNEGLKNFQQGNFEKALHLFEQTIQENNHCSQAYFNAGVVYYYQNNYDQAQQKFKNAIQCNNEYAKAHYYSGLVYQQQGELDNALEEFGIALTCNPLFDDAYLQMARITRDQGNMQKAQKLYRHFLNKQPDNISINLEYGNLLVKNNEFEQAVPVYEHILKQDSNNNSVRLNLAHTLRYLGTFDQAIPHYQQVVKTVPNNASAHYGLAESLLATKDFQNGWRHWKWRWKREKNNRNFAQKLWNGEPLQGKTILLRAEYGQGDTIQFIRYAKLLKQSGTRVVAEVQHSLVNLLSLCPYLDFVFGINQHSVEQLHFDYQIPVMSLPRFFGNTPNNDAIDFPYIYPQPELINFWHNQIKQDTQCKIGICWATSPYYASLRSPLSQKDVPLLDFAPLLQTQQCSFYSLQQIDGLEQLEQLPKTMELKTFEDFDKTHGRFMDTAALITHLDLIITVDTSVAHLAGALGKEVWMLLPFVADWRWPFDKLRTGFEKSAWYPNMRLFRQTQPGNWDTVIEQIKDELEKKVTNKKTTHKIMAEIAVGELFDKITILKIKNEHITDENKLRNIRTELATLVATAKKYIPESRELNQLISNLQKTNAKLWSIEDDIRDKERNKEFDDEFIKLARTVYLTNDQRCAWKRKINELCGSHIVEEKSYKKY